MKNDIQFNQLKATPWAILPEVLKALCENGPEAISSKNERGIARPRGVALIPLHGVVTQKQTFFSYGLDRFSEAFQEALSDDSITDIVLDIDSPGGSVFGVSEIARDIFQARGKKNITAVVNSLGASAAYWIGSAAGEMVLTPGGLVGSIGVYTTHVSIEGALEEQGIEVTLVAAGKYKVEGNPYEALTDEAYKALQSEVNDYYKDFIEAVALHRGASPEDVANGYGEGRVLGARRAVSAGLVDRVATLKEVLLEKGIDLNKRRSRDNRRSAFSRAVKAAYLNTK